ncbi:MbtH family protein [Burkholderia pseudomallei]|nr:balhimycin biosynthetic protein MbtH [Burkholderia pseudomallei]
MTQAQQPASAPADADDVVYAVVVNDEEQYSIWPTFRALPAGWREAGVRGPKAECLAHIEAVWTDMRPASLRRHLDAARAS